MSRILDKTLEMPVQRTTHGYAREFGATVDCSVPKAGLGKSLTKLELRAQEEINKVTRKDEHQKLPFPGPPCK